MACGAKTATATAATIVIIVHKGFLSPPPPPPVGIKLTPTSSPFLRGLSHLSDYIT